MKELREIQALIQLIDDPDDNVFEHVRDRLRTYGSEAIPFLESSWEQESMGLLFQSRIENLIHEIQFEEIKRDLSQWAETEDKDLLRGAVIVSRYQYPGLDEQLIIDTIQQLRRDVWLELNDNMTAFEKVNIMNRIYFGLYKFHGDTKNFHSPMNSFLNTVIESRKGNPLSLCLIYSIIAQSLDLPIYGVNLPNHFILAFMDEYGSGQYLKEKNDYGILFYINPFSKGTIFGMKDIKEFLDGLNLPHERSYFEPCSHSDIIRRMITNLISSFQQVGNAKKVDELTQLRDLIP